MKKLGKSQTQKQNETAQNFKAMQGFNLTLGLLFDRKQNNLLIKLK